MDTPLSVLLNEKGYKIESVTPNESAFDCATKLTQRKVGALLVIENGRLIGIVSERDILNKIVSIGADAKKIIVSNIMTTNLITVSPTTTVREAMRIVTDNRVRHLPVMDKDHLVGIISIGDLTKWAMQIQEQQISSLKNYIAGER